MSLIVLLNANNDHREPARLKKCLARYELVLLVVVTSKVLSAVKVALQYRRNEDGDMQRAVDYLASASTNLSDDRNRFVEMKNETSTVYAKSGVEEKFEQKRINKTKSHFGKLSCDVRLTDAGNSFSVNVVNVTSQLQQRFSSMKFVAEKFYVINPGKLNDEQVLQRSTTFFSVNVKMICHRNFRS